jgi:hypothetical protein
MKAIEKKLMPTKFPSYSMVGPYFYKILNNKRALVVCNEEDSPEISDLISYENYNKKKLKWEEKAANTNARHF